MKNLVTFGLALTLAACAESSSTEKSAGSKAVDISQYAPKFSQLNDGDVVNYAGREIHHHVKVDDLPSGIALTQEIVPPKTLGAPPHIHAEEDEIFVVLSGKIHFLNGTDEVIGEAGTVASLPRGYYHGFWNPYDEPSNLLLVVAPGHFTEFFADVEAAIAKGGPKTPPEIGAIIAEQAAARNVIVDMSKLPESGLALLGPPPE